MTESADKPLQMDERESKLYDILDEYARDTDMPIRTAANQILALYRPAPDPAVVERLKGLRSEMFKGLQCLYLTVEESVAIDTSNRVSAYVTALERLLGIEATRAGGGASKG